MRTARLPTIHTLVSTRCHHWRWGQVWGKGPCTLRSKYEDIWGSLSSDGQCIMVNGYMGLPTLPPCEQTDMTDNMRFPQHSWRAVKIRISLNPPLEESGIWHNKRKRLHIENSKQRFALLFLLRRINNHSI